MQLLKVSMYEVITALGLMGIVHVFLAFQHDPRLMNPAIMLGEVIALYTVTALASEALIISVYRPSRGWVLGINVLVAAIITQPGFSHTNALKDLFGVAVMTAILRILIAVISLSASKVGVRRFTSVLVGAPLLLAMAWTGFNLIEQAYYNYYFFPKFKEGYIMPTRWQGFVALVVLWGVIFLLLYVSYRLLKYAFRTQTGTKSRVTGPVA